MRIARMHTLPDREVQSKFSGQNGAQMSITARPFGRTPFGTPFLAAPGTRSTKLYAWLLAPPRIPSVAEISCSGRERPRIRGLLYGRFDICRRSTLSCWRRIRISATSFVLGLKNEAMIWRISRRNSIIKWQGYRVSALRLAESNFRYTQALANQDSKRIACRVCTENVVRLI